MYFLALAALLALDQYAPKIVAPPMTFAECKAAAEEANATDEDLKLAEYKAAGVQYVCLELKK